MSSTAGTSSSHGSSTGAPALTTTTVRGLRVVDAPRRARPGGRAARATSGRSPRSRPRAWCRRRRSRRRRRARARPRRSSSASASPNGGWKLSWNVTPCRRRRPRRRRTTSSVSPSASVTGTPCCGGANSASPRSAPGAQRELSSKAGSPSQREPVAARPGAADDVLARRARRASVVWTSIAATARIERAEPRELADLALLGGEHRPSASRKRSRRADVGDRQPRVRRARRART